MQVKGLFRKNNPWLFFSVRAIDVAAVMVSAWLAYGWKFGSWQMMPRYQLVLLLIAVLLPVIFPRMGVYRGWRGGNVFHNLHRVFLGIVMLALTLIVLAFTTKTSVQYSREWFFVWVALSVPVLLLFRLALFLLLHYLRRQGWNQVGVILVGAGELGRDIARRIRAADWSGYTIEAFFDDDPALQGTEVEGIPVRGTVAEVADYLREQGNGGQREVWIALPLRAEEQVKAVLHDLRHSPVAIRYIPNIFGFRLLNHDVSQIGGIPIIDLNVTPMVGLNRVIKGIEDRLLAALILLLISPVMLLIAIGVKLSSPGPVFYRQQRVSWNGEPFEMLKFRSMPVDAEAATGPVWAKEGERRATRFGAFLRRTSLDELPQFINVLKGEMSIVGPRPERPVFVDRFKDEIPDYMMKHMVKAGITGWAQVNGWRGDTDLQKRIEYDLYYIEHWSLWFDLKIIFLTLFKGFVNRNAY